MFILNIFPSKINICWVAQSSFEYTSVHTWFRGMILISYHNLMVKNNLQLNSVDFKFCYMISVTWVLSIRICFLSGEHFNIVNVISCLSSETGSFQLLGQSPKYFRQFNFEFWNQPWKKVTAIKCVCINHWTKNNKIFIL